MWVCMAIQTRGQIRMFPMEGPATFTHMAPGAIGHNLIKILFSGIIHMVLPMAAGTVNLMLAAGIFECFKHRVMTPGAVCRRQRLNVHLIKGCFVRLCGLCCSGYRHTSKSAYQNGHQSNCNDYCNAS